MPEELREVNPHYDEEAVEALQDLLDLAVELRRSGILALLKTIAEMGERVEEFITTDSSILRSVALAQAALSGIGRPGPEEFMRARVMAEESVECLVKGLASAKSDGIKPVGLLGLIKAMRDQRVQTGLGMLIALARGLGECLLKKDIKGKQ